MKKGGYQIVDFGGVNITGGGVEIPGVYETLEGNYKKPTLVSGLITDGVERADCFVVFTGGGNGDYTGTIPGLGSLTVTSADNVTFTAVAG